MVYNRLPRDWNCVIYSLLFVIFLGNTTSCIHPFILTFICTYQGIEDGRVFIEKVTTNSHKHQHGLQTGQKHREAEFQLLAQGPHSLLVLAVESKLNGVEGGADILELCLQQQQQSLQLRQQPISIYALPNSDRIDDHPAHAFSYRSHHSPFSLPTTSHKTLNQVPSSL